jgi:protein-disulfide isomerase
MPATRGDGALSEAQTRSIEGVIERYLGDHPELVGYAIHTLQERQKSATLAQQQGAVKAKGDAIFRDPADLVLGNPQGDVTLVEFFDYRCPYCKRAAPDVAEAVKADGHIRLVLKEFPILGPNSQLAARAALASAKQGKYATFHAALLAAKSDLDEASVMAIAEANGIDTGRLAEDMKDPAIEAQIKRNFDLADALRIEGTPAFVIGDKLVPGAIDKAEIEKLARETRETKG